MKQKQSEESNKDNVWLSASTGDKAIDFQKNAQMTWWSILQGIAVVTLFGNLSIIFNAVFKEQKWYLLLFTICTFMIIVNVWVQMAWAILIYRWHLSLVHTALILLLGTTTQLTCMYVDNPTYWSLAVAALTISATIVYRYNISQKVLLGLPVEKVRFVIGLYLGYAGLCLIAAYTLQQYPISTLHVIWGLLFMVAATFSWKVQIDNMNFERRERNIP